MINLEQLQTFYFTFDKEVPYELDKENKKFVNIKPIYLEDSPLFLNSCDVLAIEKNQMDSVEIIQMSYLEFLLRYVLSDEVGKIKFSTVLFMCLGWERWKVIKDENNKTYLCELNEDIRISSKQFDDIRRIIMYQNIIDYDDEYIDSDLKKAIRETKEIKNKNVDFPSLERRMAIITSHTGISKAEQMKMTYRSHTSLFTEVSGELEFTTTRAVALISGEANKIDHYIYPKRKGKYDDYIKKVSDIEEQSKGGLKSSISQETEQLLNKYEQFN